MKYINGLSYRSFVNNSYKNNLFEYAGTGLHIKANRSFLSFPPFQAHSLDSIIYLNLAYGVKIITILLKELPFHISILQS